MKKGSPNTKVEFQAKTKYYYSLNKVIQTKIDACKIENIIGDLKAEHSHNEEIIKIFQKKALFAK